MRCIQAAIWIQAILALVFWGATVGVAQVVQLPSTRSLSYSGSAWVPDGGSADLGGVASAYGSHSRRGGSSISTSSLGTSSLSASVQIIDLAALDEAMLGATTSPDPAQAGDAKAVTAEPADTAGVPTPAAIAEPSVAPADIAPAIQPPNPRPATDLSIPVSARVGADPAEYLRALGGAGDVSGIDPAQLENDIRYYISQGEHAERAGRVVAAKVFYRMARDLMPPELVARYEAIVAQRRAAEEARVQAELDSLRRRF